MLAGEYRGVGWKAGTVKGPEAFLTTVTIKGNTNATFESAGEPDAGQVGVWAAALAESRRDDLGPVPVVEVPVVEVPAV